MSEYKNRFFQFARLCSVSLTTGAIVSCCLSNMANAQRPFSMNGRLLNQIPAPRVIESKSTVQINGQTYSADVLKCPICRERLGLAPLPPGAETIVGGHENEGSGKKTIPEPVTAKPLIKKPQGTNKNAPASPKTTPKAQAKRMYKSGTPDVPHQTTLTPLTVQAMEQAAKKRDVPIPNVTSKMAGSMKDNAAIAIDDDGASKLQKTLSEMPKSANLNGIPPKARQALLDGIELPEGGRILSYNIVETESANQKDKENSEAENLAEPTTLPPTDVEKIATDDVADTRTEIGMPLNLEEAKQAPEPQLITPLEKDVPEADAENVPNEIVDEEDSAIVKPLLPESTAESTADSTVDSTADSTADSTNEALSVESPLDAKPSMAQQGSGTRSMETSGSSQNAELLELRQQNEAYRQQLSAMEIEIKIADQKELTDFRDELILIQTGIMENQKALIDAQKKYWNEQLAVSSRILDVLKENNELHIQLLDQVKSVGNRLVEIQESPKKMSNAINQLESENQAALKKLQQENRATLEKLKRQKQVMEKTTQRELKKQTEEYKNEIAKLQKKKDSDIDALQQRVSAAEAELDKQSERRKQLEERLRKLRQKKDKKKKNK